MLTVEVKLTIHNKVLNYMQIGLLKNKHHIKKREQSETKINEKQGDLDDAREITAV